MPGAAFPNSTIYLELTDEFNDGATRAILCGGQAVVLHRLAIMSKDGDWILREEADALEHVLGVLERRSANYRFGAPLDVRWMRGGWSSHLEFQDAFRVRTDFFTRPPRLAEADLRRIWTEQENRDPAFLAPRDLAEMKKTNREKDYVVIGELGRLMTSIEERLLYSRSARELAAAAGTHGDLARRLATERPLLAELENGVDHIARLLDEERRALMRANEQRLVRYTEASRDWAAVWPVVADKIRGLPLREAHHEMVASALGVLPFEVEEVPNG